jgi:tetratricopeptide (TPR) repeat protein
LIRGQLAEAERARGEASKTNLARVVNDSLNDELWRTFVEVWYRRRGIEKLEETIANRPFSSVPLLTSSYLPTFGASTYYLAAARIYAMAHRPDRARTVLDQFRADKRDTASTRAAEPDVHAVRGEIALAERRPLLALDEFRLADRLPDGPVNLFALWNHADMGRAFDQAGMADSAIASFERFLKTPQLNRLWHDAIYLAPILQRLGDLYAARGDRTKAIEYYARFVALWRDADPELQPQVTAVRRRIEELRKSR